MATVQQAAQFQSLLGDTVLTLFHVAKTYRFPGLPYGVHMYLAYLASIIDNRTIVRQSASSLTAKNKKDLEQCLKECSKLPEGLRVSYNASRSTGDFYLNFGAMEEAGYIANRDDFHPRSRVEFKHEIEMVEASYSFASTFARRLSLGALGESFKIISDNPEMFYDLMVGYYAFKKKVPGFSPGKDVSDDFMRAYLTNLLRKEAKHLSSSAKFN